MEIKNEHGLKVTLALIGKLGCSSTILSIYFLFSIPFKVKGKLETAKQLIKKVYLSLMTRQLVLRIFKLRSSRHKQVSQDVYLAKKSFTKVA